MSARPSDPNELATCRTDLGPLTRKLLEQQQEIERLRAELDRLGPLMLRASAEITQLRAERDEARRMYCEAVILHGTAHRFDANGVPEEITEAEELARRLKWDCFKENTND